MRRFILILFAMLAIADVNANPDVDLNPNPEANYAVEVLIDKKIIYVHSLGLPESTTIQEVLNIMPEILSRPGTFLVTNYVIKIEGLAVGDASDNVLRQLRIADVEKIEVQESPIDTYNHNGEGGSINIFLADKEKGLSGNVALDGGYQPDVMGGVNLSYKTDNGWRLHGLFKGEYYDPTEQTIEGGAKVAYPEVINYDEMSSANAGKKVAYAYSTTLNDRFVGQMARFYARHKSKYSAIELAFGEDNSYTKSIRGVDAITKKKVFTLLGHGKYTYNFEQGSQFAIKADYQFTPTNNWQNTIPTALDETTKQNMLTSNVEYVQPLLKMFYAHMNLKFGANVNYFWTYRPNDWREKTFHVMPYVKMDGHVNNWRFQVEAEYQNYSYNLADNAGKDVSTLDKKNRSDITGLLGIAYQITKNQQLKFVADRKIQRQDSYSLNPMKFNELQLDYIINHVSDAGSWVLNLGAGYILAQDIWKNLGLGTGTSYWLSDNKNNILHADAMGLYQRGIFSLALTGNVYSCKMNYKDLDTDTYTYYNISVLPSLNFKNGLHVALHYVHNSHINQWLTSMSALNYMRMTVGKDFGRLNVHVYGQLNLNKCDASTVGYGFDDKGNIDYIYAAYQTYVVSSLRNSVGVGVRYSF